MTWQREVVEQVLTTNARVYGSAGLLERRVFPELGWVEGDEVQANVFMESETLYRAMQVPQGDCFGDIQPFSDKEWETPGYCLRDVDMYSSTGGVSVGNEYIGAFYVASWTGLLAPDTNLIRPMMPLPMFGLSYFNLFVTPFTIEPTKIIDGYADLGATSNADYMIGLRGGYGGVALHGGYKGSSQGSGFFGNVTDHNLGLLASAVIDGELSDLPYLKVGRSVARTAKAMPDWPVEPLAFVRKIELAAPATLKPPSLWSGHLGAASEFVDATVAVGAAGEPLLHEVNVLLHSSNWDLADPDDRELDEFQFAANFGMIQLPAMPWYGLEQEVTPFASVEAEYYRFHAVVGFNHSETLTYFPMARRSFRVGLQYTLVGGTQ